MPPYDLVLILKKLDRPALVNSLKRSANYILEQGGIVKKIDNLGFRETPYKIRAHGVTYKEANYFILNLDIPYEGLEKVHEGFRRDKDIIKKSFILLDQTTGNLKEKKKKECTLEEDLLPPPYRRKVKEMMDIAEKNRPYRRYDFKYNSGLDYYPFTR